MKKKGLSSVVATVLIILLVIAAVALIWTPVRNMISQQSEKVQGNCLLVNINAEACDNGDDLKIKVSNGPETKIDSFQVVYGLEGVLTTSKEIEDGLGKNEENTFTVSGAGNAEQFRIAAKIGEELCPALPAKDVKSSC